MHSAPASPPPQRLGRRTYIVDRRFQLKYTAILSVLGALISLFFGGMMALALRDTQLQLQAQGNLPPEVVAQTTTLLWLMVGITVLMAVALAMFGVLITHRVAGPIYVMSNYISILAQGRYPKMRPLRRSDELKDFFQKFQDAIEALRLREADEAQILSAALTRFERLDLDGEAARALESLREMSNRKRDASNRMDIAAPSRKNAA